MRSARRANQRCDPNVNLSLMGLGLRSFRIAAAGAPFVCSPVGHWSQVLSHASIRDVYDREQSRALRRDRSAPQTPRDTEILTQAAAALCRARGECARPLRESA